MRAPAHTRICVLQRCACSCTHSCVCRCSGVRLHALTHTHGCEVTGWFAPAHTHAVYSSRARPSHTSAHTHVCSSRALALVPTHLCTERGSCVCTLAHTLMCAAAGHHALAHTQDVCRTRGVRWHNLTPTHVSEAAGHQVLTHTHVCAEKTGWCICTPAHTLIHVCIDMPLHMRVQR